MPRASVIIVGITAILTFLWGGLFFYARSFNDRVLLNVFVGDLSVGGMKREQLTRVIRDRVEKLNERGIPVTVSGSAGTYSTTISPFVVTEDTTRELIQVDEETAANGLLSYGKRGNIFAKMIAPLRTWIVRPSIALSGVVVDREGLLAAMGGRLLSREVPARDAFVEIKSETPLAYELHDATTGISYGYDAALNEIISKWIRLEPPSIRLTETRTIASLQKKDIESILHRLPMVLQAEPLTITYTDREGRGDRTWQISKANTVSWLQPIRMPKGDIVFGLRKDALETYLNDTVAAVVALPPQDAKFRIDSDGKVIEFQGSHVGVSLDMEATIQAIEEAFADRTRHDEGLSSRVPIVVAVAEPTITTGEANELGITEILGVGTSNFSGSPTNRIKNIRHAVEKLNGILIKPGDTFSTLAHVGPFTQEGGYLPELVIKGNALEPEIGGGLCQIGTTLFRMAMNGGMDITARRNHSLVVQYYGDPRNGNPGTDATIYDPLPDFRFLNDTGSHVLMETDINTQTGDLIFTLWGTNDGRTASYTPPIVSRWIPHGEKKNIETTKLKPGETRCQKAFNGAEASFTYARELADGTREERVFESYYRPLPEICLVGVAELTTSSTAPEIIGAPNG